MVTRAGCFLVGAILIAACGTSNTASQSAATPSTAAVLAPPASPSPAAQVPRQLNFQVGALANSTVTGTVGVNVSASGYTLTIVLSGLDPNSEHTINLHSGTCSLINTDKISTFIDDAKADAAGKLSSVTTWTDAYGIPAAGRVVTVHGNAATGGYAGNAMTHIACASLMA